MAASALSGRVAVVATGHQRAAAAVARRLADEGAAVVLVAEAGDEEGLAGAGRTAAELQAHSAGSSARAAVFTLTGTAPSDLDALVELLGELFR